MESEISQVKLIVKNMVLRSPRTSFMHMRVKKPNCLLPLPDWISLTTEKIDISSAKSLQFEDTPFDNSLTLYGYPQEAVYKESHLLANLSI